MKEIDEAFFILLSSMTQKSQKISIKKRSWFQNKRKKKVAIKILDKGKIKTKKDLIRIQR